MNQPNKQYNSKYKKNKYIPLSEEDFYPAPDNRYLKSYVYDMDNDENFYDYCMYWFNVCDENEIFN